MRDETLPGSSACLPVRRRAWGMASRTCAGWCLCGRHVVGMWRAAAPLVIVNKLQQCE